MKKIKFLALGSVLSLVVNVTAQNFNKTPYVGADGVMEVGKYIDFHNSNANVVDNEGRLQSDNGLLRVLNTSLYLAPTGEKYGWSNTNLFWSGHSLVMGSPTGAWSHNRLELKPGGSSAGDCENEFMLYRTKSDLTSECKVKFSTNANNYFMNNVGIGTTEPNYKLDVNGDIHIPNGYSYWIGSNTNAGNMLRLHHNGSEAYIDYLPTLNFRSGLSTTLTLNQNGTVGIGTTTTGSHKLAVEGSIGAREVRVYLGGWADFVFEKDYKLPSLEEVEEHIKENGHLKDIPSAAEVAQEGVSVGEMNTRLLQKVEELTLYMIEQNKQIQALQLQVSSLSK